MDTQIESRTLTIGSLFIENYTVPRYQREFVWEKEQVLDLMDDIFNAFSNDNSLDYFIGSIVVCRNLEGSFDVIDGQQRLTTIYIALCIFRDLIDKYKTDPKSSSDFIKFMISHFGNDSQGQSIHQYRLTLNYSDSRDSLKKIADSNVDSLSDAGHTKSMTNIINAYSEILQYLEAETKGDESDLRRLAAYLKDKVKLIRIETKDVNQALRIYETINSRGVSLNPMDLLKNLIFMKALSADFSKITDNWRSMINNINYTKEPPARFLIYYVSAFHSDKVINENQVYQWFLENSEVYKSPLVFSKELLQASEAFKAFSDGNNPDGSENRYLKSIKLQNSKSTRHLIPLLSISRKGKVFSEEVARFLENLLFLHMITSTNTRKLDTKFVDISRKISKMNKIDDVVDYLEVQYGLYRESFYDRFIESLSSPNFGVTYRTKLRYIVGRMSQDINERAYGSAGAESKIQTFVNADVEIEHILPLKPSHAAKKEFGDDRSVSTHQNKLGNLALIEKSINGSVGNKSYSKKKSGYSNSKFLLTKSISGSVDLGNTLIAKAVVDLEAFDIWDSRSVDRRTDQLITLAKRIWNMEI